MILAHNANREVCCAPRGGGDISLAPGWGQLSGLQPLRRNPRMCYPCKTLEGVPLMLRIVVVTTLLLAAASSASATLAFFMNDPGGFAAAVAANPVLGTEDFESSTLGPLTSQFFDDPLAPGVANASFPAGTNAAMGLTIQSNFCFSGCAALWPRGADALLAQTHNTDRF